MSSGSEVREDGGQGQNRTGDTTIFSRMLYQLSYLAIPGLPDAAVLRTSLQAEQNVEYSTLNGVL